MSNSRLFRNSVKHRTWRSNKFWKSKV